MTVDHMTTTCSHQLGTIHFLPGHWDLGGGININQAQKGGAGKKIKSREGSNESNFINFGGEGTFFYTNREGDQMSPPPPPW